MAELNKDERLPAINKQNLERTKEIFKHYSFFNKELLYSKIKTILNEKNIEIDSFIQSKGLVPMFHLDIFALKCSTTPYFIYLTEDADTLIKKTDDRIHYLITYELGYGTSPLARLNETQLEELYKEAIVLENNIVGFIRWWQVSQEQKGTFMIENIPLDSEVKFHREITIIDPFMK